jgi:hypothetical protein
VSPPLRASNEGLLRPRVARAQGTRRAIPPLLAGFFNTRYSQMMLEPGDFILKI